jgi:hypothetical protein
MISSEQFSVAFKARHNFQHEGQKFLQEQYPGICFKDIPEGWFAPLEEVVFKIKDKKKIKAIYQLYGFLVIEHCITNEKDLKLLDVLRKRIELTDQDLHELLSNSKTLN